MKEITEEEYNTLKHKADKLDEIVSAIEEVQERLEESGTDDVGEVVLNILDMWL